MRVLLLFVLYITMAPAFAFSGPPKKVVTVEGVTEYRLENGCRVLLFPDRSRSTVTVNMTVLVGSRHEGYGETGMAHLLEHMVFKGTPTYPDIPKALRDHGANFNGTTNHDRTNYYETMPANNSNLEFGIALEADRLVNSFIRREDLISEMTVVRNEFEQGENSPTAILGEKTMAAAFEWHNYGKSTIGNRSDIERVPIDTLKSFYKRFYQSDNAVLIVAGKFEEATAMELAAKYFGALPKPSRVLDRTYTEEPAQDGERLVTLRRVGTVGAVTLVYHVVAGPHPDFAACEVLGNVLTAQPSGRLHKALVATQKASGIEGGAFPLHDPGVIEFTARCDPANLEFVRTTMIEVVENIAKNPLTVEEVERAVRQIKASREQLMTDAGRVSGALSEWSAKGDWRLFFVHRDRLEKVAASDVARVAEQFLKRSNRTLGVYTPTTKPDRVVIASAPNVADVVKDYRGRTVVATGEGFDTSPANLDARTRIEDLGGVRAALLPRKTRGETATILISLKYGNEDSLRGQATAARFLGPLMTRGTTKHTRQQLEDELDELGARLSAGAGGFGRGGRGGDPGGAGLGTLTFSLTAKRGTLPKAIALLGEVLRSPAFSQEEFEELRAAARAAIETGKTEPMMLASLALQRKLSPHPRGDVRYVPTMDESLVELDCVTVQDVKKLYEQQVSGRSGELAAVGDFDPDELAKQFRGIFANWEAGVPHRRIARPAVDGLPGEKITINTPDKANAMFVAGLVFPQDDANREFAALEMGNFLLGGGTLSSRLGNRVRQKDGLSYGVASNYAASAQDPASQFFVFAICNPDNMAKVDAAITEEVNRFLDDGVSMTELEDGKKAYLESMKVQRSNDRQIAQTLLKHLEVGRTFTFQLDLEKKIAELTPAQIQAAYKKHLAIDRLVVIHAGDFK